MWNVIAEKKKIYEKSTHDDDNNDENIDNACNVAIILSESVILWKQVTLLESLLCSKRRNIYKIEGVLLKRKLNLHDIFITSKLFISM